MQLVRALLKEIRFYDRINESSRNEFFLLNITNPSFTSIEY
jgi:hypothetical protein